MIDFSNGSVFKLNPCSQEEIVSQVAPILIPGEQVSPASKRFGTSPPPADSDDSLWHRDVQGRQRVDDGHGL
jgi:hypothetical protein